MSVDEAADTRRPAVSANSESESGGVSDAAAGAASELPFVVPLDEALAAAAASPHVDSQAAATAGTPAMHDNNDSGTPSIVMPLAANFDSSDIAATDTQNSEKELKLAVNKLLLSYNELFNV